MAILWLLLSTTMNKHQGFTLLEILIALSVFVILATITSTAMHQAFETRARVNKGADRLSSLQIAMTLLQRDTEQATTRAIRSNEMRLFPAFTGQTHYLELTRHGIANPNSKEKRSTLQRVAFLCHGKQLLRRSWDSLDPINRKHYEDKVLLDELLKCQFAYLNHNLQVLPEWRENALKQNQRQEPLPKAIQLKITLNDWGKMSFLFIIPEALYGEN